ncbi:tetratricopeptide repeat protein 27 [Impatiens glandulifera]|uniref:tetratricopeptide repeat protein 27 n=1 Tax=Impatiens glandulifera TaxID=253017 RepID=UPI001FB0890A|nr:tetratricopeptide repeat protein 27 [Impatiens glandulifera]
MTGEEESFNHLRSSELRLLRCSLPPPTDLNGHISPPFEPSKALSDRHSLALSVENVMKLIESGNYTGVLSSDVARKIFSSKDTEFGMADSFYNEYVYERVQAFLIDESQNEIDKGYRVFLLMAVAVSSFLAFIQCNITGPFEKMSSFPLSGLGLRKEESGDADWESWARNQLMEAGSDLLGKFVNLQYIIFAKIVLIRIKDILSEGDASEIGGIRSISIWLLRLLFLHQRIMDEKSSSLFDLLQVYMHETLRHFGTTDQVSSYWGTELQHEEASTIVSMFHLEAGIVDYTYGRVDSSRSYFGSAEGVAGLRLSVTGALGLRTVHQVDPKAQRLLVANIDTTTDVADRSLPRMESQESACSTDTENLDGCHPERNEASDVFMTPKFVKDDKCSGDITQNTHSGGKMTANLKQIQQAVVLAHCLLIEKSTPHDDMQRWDMAPYIEAIDSQQTSCFIIRYYCDILRIRWESTRSRTKERALLMMDKLVENMYNVSPGVAQRMHCFFGAYTPTISALRKEYGELLIRCGLIGEAVKVFEDLELWDSLIYCYRLLEKKAASVELIKSRLSKLPNDPRLWCSLGDVTNEDSCYEKALEVSGNRSARAKRSLARSAYNRGDYSKSKSLWASAMALNSLYPDGWFALGAAALKARDVEKALDAFTSAVQLDPENGEAWNNIACLHMIKKKNKEAFIAFKEALKYKRNNWQLWENFSYVSADVGNTRQALEAVEKVVDITNNKRIDTVILERIMSEVEGLVLTDNSQSDDVNHIGHISSDANDSSEPSKSETGLAITRETDHLVDLIGKILQKIVRSGGGADIWGLYARWHKLKGDLTMCSEALLKQIRSYQGSDLWKDGERFKKFAHASLNLCQVYVELSSRDGSRKELFSAEMHLKNTIKQAGSFSETEEYENLLACLNMVQMKLAT